MTWTLREVAAATGGQLRGDPAATVSGVAIDSRTIKPGELFVAVRGDRFDGHDYVGSAVEAGAGAVVVERERAYGLARIEVTSTLQALRDLAAAARSRMRVPLIGITGSTGKTSTKDLATAALGDGAWGSPRSFNNEVGVPLTILWAPADTRVVVAEVGSRGRGHIAWLGSALQPDVAVITNIGQVHLETFGSVDELVKGKWELVEALPADGVAVLPAADDRLPADTAPRVLTFGIDEGDVAAHELVVADGRAQFRLVTPVGNAEVRLQLAGRHQVANAAAAAAAALAVGAELEEIAAGLGRATAAEWRFEVHRGDITVVNDAYNANPQSTAAALRATLDLGDAPLAVLGLMAELGSVSRDEHLHIGRLAAELGYRRIIVVGDDPGIAEGFGSDAVRVADTAAAADAVAACIEEHDVILVKGSRVVGLEGLAVQLAEESGQ